MKCVLDWGSKALTGIDGLCQNRQLFHLQPNINNTNPTKGPTDKLCKTLRNSCRKLLRCVDRFFIQLTFKLIEYREKHHNTPICGENYLYDQGMNSLCPFIPLHRYNFSFSTSSYYVSPHKKASPILLSVNEPFCLQQ